MAALGEVPFGRYYGSIDATPLFVALAHAYWQRTGDLATIEQLWPNLEAALAWLERDGLDGGRFVAYRRRTEQGLINQGWKDSADSVFHADGTLAAGPIALCEVQGYAYAAWLGAARLAEALGRPERAGELRRRAEALRGDFERAFWCEDLGTYALALDGEGRPCRVRSSNAGQCLFTGIAVHEHATRVVRTLLDEASWSGWGIRTIAAGEARYNPMSYHDGSVWPHDNSLIASGMARYGFAHEARRIFAAVCEAARWFDLQRLPELFCGFARRPNEGPTLYPVACSPQAWSIGAVFLCLQTCLGIQVDGAAQRITICRPLLLPGVDELTIGGLAVGSARVDVTFHRRRSGEGCAVDVTPLEGEVQIRLLK
jgi:glycogen debranching enzyme